jgi:hypothetical protein
MPHEEERTYRFDDFMLEASEHRLRRGRQEIDLPPKTFDQRPPGRGAQFVVFVQELG